MNITLNLLVDIIKRPRETFTRIVSEQTLKEAFIIVVISGLCTSFVSSGSIFESNSSRAAVSIGELLGTLIIWGVSSAVWHLLAEMLGGNGRVVDLLKTIGFCYFIQILLVPFYLLPAVMPMLGTLLLAFAGFAVTVWTIVLGVLAISSVYGISGGRAAFVYFLPVLAILVLLVIIGVLMFTMLSPNEYMPLIDEIQML